MDIASLKAHLEKCLEEEKAVYAVVTIMGTTEHGAVDPLFDVLQVREEFKKKGLSFYVHADAAWVSLFWMTSCCVCLTCLSGRLFLRNARE